MLDKNFTLIICLVLLIIYTRGNDIGTEAIVAISAAVVYFFLYGEDMGLSKFGCSDGVDASKWSDADYDDADADYDDADADYDDADADYDDADADYDDADADYDDADADYDDADEPADVFEVPGIDDNAVQYHDTVNDLYKPGLGCPGDNALAKKMKHMSMKNKAAIDARSRMTKYSFMHLFDEELNDHSNSRWWDNQDLEQYF
jgi:hypothetical protein